MAFRPIALIKSDPLTVLFLGLVAVVLVMAIDDRTGGAISTRLKSLPIIGSVA